MIWFLILGISFLAFLSETWLLYQNGRFQNRRKLTGAEVARYVLDARGLKQTAVDCSRNPGRELRWGIKQLYLEKNIYEGRSLLDISQAARMAVLKTKIPIANFSPSLDLREKIWFICRFAILIAWPAILLGFLSTYLGGLQILGLVVLVIVFTLAMLDLPAEWEASHQAMVLLKDSHHFEVDELVRLKNLLNGLRLDGLSQIFLAPAYFLKGRLRGA